jgi:hypothetical protein
VGDKKSPTNFPSGNPVLMDGNFFCRPSWGDGLQKQKSRVMKQNHEGDGVPIRLQYLGCENLADGRERLNFECPTAAEFFNMPSGVKIGRCIFKKMHHDTKRGVAFYETESPAEQSFNA